MSSSAPLHETDSPPVDGPDLVLKPFTRLRLPATLSPSRAAAWMKCPRSAALERLDVTPEPPGCPSPMVWAGRVGTWAHAVLEGLFGLQRDLRTVAAAADILRALEPELRADPEWVAMGLSTEQELGFRADVWTGVSQLFDLVDPMDQVVIATELKLETTIGGVPTFSVCDLVHMHRKTRHARVLAITDWKFGKWKEPFRSRSGETVEVSAYEHQVRWYAAGVRTMLDERPAVGRLVYPVSQHVEMVDVSEAAVAGTVDVFGEVWSDLSSVYTAAIADQGAGGAEAFPARPAILCGWCKFLPICADGQGFLRDGDKLGVWAAKPRNADKVCPGSAVLTGLDEGWTPRVEFVPSATVEGAEPVGCAVSAVCP